MRIVNQQQMSEDVPAGPGFGLKKAPAFGLSRDPINRVEIVLAMKGGGVINLFEQVEDELNPERLERYAAELADQVGAGRVRSFADAWTATGQRSWVNLGEVSAFTVRQAK